MAKILGIDEAGRGAVIGPLIICGALISEKKLQKLKELRVRDSKLLSANQRNNLAPQIRLLLDEYEVIKISPKKIDSQRKRGISLNDIEAEKMAHIVNEYRPATVYIDAIDRNIKTFSARIKKFLQFSPKKMILEHEADVNYPIVSAASIIAKVERDGEVSALEKNYGTMGSGYPSDPLTKSFLKEWLKEHGKLPVEIIRETWSTAEAFKAKGKQKSLQEWLSKNKDNAK